MTETESLDEKVEEIPTRAVVLEYVDTKKVNRVSYKTFIKKLKKIYGEENVLESDEKIKGLFEVPAKIYVAAYENIWFNQNTMQLVIGSCYLISNPVPPTVKRIRRVK